VSVIVLSRMMDLPKKLDFWPVTGDQGSEVVTRCVESGKCHKVG